MAKFAYQSLNRNIGTIHKSKYMYNINYIDKFVNQSLN